MASTPEQGDQLPPNNSSIRAGQEGFVHIVFNTQTGSVITFIKSVPLRLSHLCTTLQNDPSCRVAVVAWVHPLE